jgi:fumarate hydratase class II
MGTRIEKDPLGELEVPDDALYGIQTVRALHNFAISGFAPLEPFVVARTR